MWKSTVFFVAASAVVYSAIRYFSGATCQCLARLDGLVIIITGGNSGIGKALAHLVARRGAEVILAVRDLKSGQRARKEIIADSNNPNVHVKFLDLNSIDSVIAFAHNIQQEFLEVYALVNNAGVFFYPQELTEDGFDVTLQTNYLSPFILTHYLLRVFKNAEHARIINVSSEAHRFAREYDLKSVLRSQTEPRGHFLAYGVSKLALILFTREFAKRLTNTNIIINAVDPGNVETSIYRYFPPLNNPWLFALQYPIRLLVIKSPTQGAQTALHALLTSHRNTGQYISDCRVVLPSPVALNDRLCNDFYNLTLEILDAKFDTESEC